MDHALRSERLLYEPLRADHASALAPALTDPQVNAHFDDGGPSDTGELEAGFRRALAGPGPNFPPGTVFLNFAVRLLNEPVFIGRVEATLQPENAEVAYLLGPSFWGFGYAQEATRWLQERIQVEFGVRTFWGTTVAANVRSIGVLEGLGYRAVEPPPDVKLFSYDPGDLVFRLDV